MTQEVISPVDQKVRERIRAFKTKVKLDARNLRELKLCRKTKKPHPKRDEFMAKFKCDDASDLHFAIRFMKQDATINLIAYGQLRGKEHTVKDPDQYVFAVKTLLAKE